MENNVQNLGKRSIKGGFWVFSIRIIGKGLGIVRLIILARLLAPMDFGLMGIALLTITTLETLSQTGFQAALIQKKNNIEPFLNAAWTFLILRGFIIFSILFFSAPLVATFFKSPDSMLIIQVLGISSLLQSFSNIGIIYFLKELKFHKQFLFEFSGALVDFAVSITLAILLRNVWALVIGLLAGQTTKVGISYLIHSFKPGISFDLNKIKELFRYGKWVLSSTVLGFLVKQGDDIMVGKILNPTMLGFYQMAFKLSNMPATEITHTISEVTFPAYSKLQDNIPRLREAFFRTVGVVSVISFPIGCGILLLAPDAIKLVLGEKWMPMVPALQILCTVGILRSITANFGSVFMSTGRPDIKTKVALINVSILAVTIYPLVVHFGILGAVYSRLLTLVTQFYTWPKVMKILKTRIKLFLNVLILPLLSTIFMAFSIIAAQLFLSKGNLISLAAQVGTGGIVYFSTLLLMDQKFDHGIRREFKTIVSAFK